MALGPKQGSQSRLTENNIPDKEFYRPFSVGNLPVFSPWLGYGSFSARYREIQPYTLVSPDRCHVLYSLASQAVTLDGYWYECGVYRGGTAMMLSRLLAEGPHRQDVQLFLFDTFEGMPKTDENFDLDLDGWFADCSAEEVKKRVEKWTGTGTAVSRLYSRNIFGIGGT